MKSTVLAVLFVVCATSANAQTPGAASIRGRVIDQTGAALPGVAVSVANIDTLTHATSVGVAATGIPAAAPGTPLTGVANVFPGRQLQLIGRFRF